MSTATIIAWTVVGLIWLLVIWQVRKRLKGGKKQFYVTDKKESGETQEGRSSGDSGTVDGTNSTSTDGGSDSEDSGDAERDRDIRVPERTSDESSSDIEGDAINAERSIVQSSNDRTTEQHLGPAPVPKSIDW